MIKHISKLIFTLAMYELGKYLMNELIVYLQSEDDIDMPKDFNQLDHIHLNAEVSE
ncbi:transcriptional activator RinB [Staphylococcus devriesei]|uniref:transcriptional activator RinB n=1 Tax=Staphylococcus devriesei TaxID=586733 RepID=UPI001F466922|nr:transcriptional activator RinB [Staphylococcus devriesei]MCE5089212.1 transcriptional regulator [Staphylococcus devriesei]